MRQRLFLLFAVMVMITIRLQAQTTYSLNGPWLFRYVKDPFHLLSAVSTYSGVVIFCLAGSPK